MHDLSLRQRLDPGRNQIPNARWLVLLLALATPGFAILLVGATLQLASEGHVTGWGLALTLFGMWIFFVGLLIAPGVWCLYRAWRRMPALQVDAWGLVWGDDWSRDLSIEWREIDAITSRLVRSRGYSDRFVLIHPKNGVVPPRVARVFRWAAWGIVGHLGRWTEVPGVLEGQQLGVGGVA
jgi:hypothetical protein